MTNVNDSGEAADIALAAADAGTPKADQFSAPRNRGERARELLVGYWDKFNQWGGREQVLTLLALTAVLGSLFFAGAEILAILAALVLILIFVAVVDNTVWFGKYLVPRLVVLIFPSTMTRHDAVATLLVFGFAICLAVEAMMRKPLDRLPNEPAANLPSMVRLHKRSLMKLQKMLFSVMMLIEATLVVVVVLDASDWSAVVLVAIAFVVQITVVVKIKLYRLAHHRMVTAKHRELKRLKPRFYVHWDGPDNGIYQVAMWAEYLNRLKLPYAVIVRKDRHVIAMAEESGAPVVHIGDMDDVDATIVPSLRAVVYVNTTLKNAHFIRFTELNHIQINHGDSDKPASVSPMFRMFNINFVAGQAAIDRFEHYGVFMPRELIRVVGRPQVEGVTATSGSVHTVLYAPTWAGFFDDSNFSSLRQGPQIVEELLRQGMRVIFRPHAFTNRDRELAAKAKEIRQILSAHREESKIEHLFGEQAENLRTIVECFNESDAMIADISSIVTDYLFSEKPVALIAANTSIERFKHSFPLSQRLPVIDGGLNNLEATIEDMLGSDSNRDERRLLNSYYLGDFEPEGYASHFLDALYESVEGSAS